MYKYWGVDSTDNILREHFPQICKCGSLPKVRCVITNILRYNPEKIDVEDTLYYACESGNTQLINFVLRLDKDLNGGMLGACKGGHIKVVIKLKGMVPKHQLDKLSYVSGFIEACKGEYITIAKMMIKYIINTSYDKKTSHHNWNKCYYAARKINNKYLIKLIQHARKRRHFMDGVI